MSYPVFGPKARSKKGKTVRIKGFMVPLDELRGKNFFCTFRTAVQYVLFLRRSRAGNGHGSAHQNAGQIHGQDSHSFRPAAVERPRPGPFDVYFGRGRFG